MKYSEIVALLDKGFTPEQIMQLHDQPAAAPQPQDTDTSEAPEIPETPVVTQKEYVEPAEPEWAKKLNENITSMKNAIYAQHIKEDMSGGEKPKTAEDVMLDVLGSNRG